MTDTIETQILMKVTQGERVPVGRLVALLGVLQTESTLSGPLSVGVVGLYASTYDVLQICRHACECKVEPYVQDIQNRLRAPLKVWTENNVDEQLGRWEWYVPFEDEEYTWADAFCCIGMAAVCGCYRFAHVLIGEWDEMRNCGSTSGSISVDACLKIRSEFQKWVEAAE